MNENVEKLVRYYEEVLKEMGIIATTKLVEAGAINPEEPIKCYIGGKLAKEITLNNRHVLVELVELDDENE